MGIYNLYSFARMCTDTHTHTHTHTHTYFLTLTIYYQIEILGSNEDLWVDISKTENIIEFLLQKALEHGFKTIRVRVRGLGPGRMVSWEISITIVGIYWVLFRSFSIKWSNANYFITSLSSDCSHICNSPRESPNSKFFMDFFT